MMRLNKQWTGIIFSIILLLVVWGALVFFGFMIFDARSEALRTQTSLTTARAEIAYGENVRMLLRDTEASREMLTEYASVSAANAFQALRVVGADAGVSVDFVSAAPAAVDIGGYNQAPILDTTFYAEGSFGEVVRFLSLVDSGPLPIIIRSASFEQVDENVNIWKLNLRVWIYTDDTDED